jgi:hypothetical protein
VGPAPAGRAGGPALFSVDDTTEHLRADDEDARQLAAVVAETTHAGVPWRVDVRKRLLTTCTVRRAPRGTLPRLLEEQVVEVREMLAGSGALPERLDLAPLHEVLERGSAPGLPPTGTVLEGHHGLAGAFAPRMLPGVPGATPLGCG